MGLFLWKDLSAGYFDLLFGASDSFASIEAARPAGHVG